MSLPPLKQIITADTSNFDGALGRSLGALRRFSVAGAAALGAVTGALTVMTARSLGTIDAQAKLARAVGGTTAAIQALERAGDRAGVQSSELAGAATRLNQRLGEVISTGKGATDTFKALGITAQQLANMDVDERFMAISDAMKRAGMSTQQMAYHLRQLGIRQTSVITLLQGGADEIRRSREAIDALGVSVSDIDAAQIEKTNDALSEMGRVFEGIGNRMAVQVAPVLEKLANRFTEMAKAGGPINEAVNRLVASFGQLADRLTSDDFLNSAVTALENMIGFAGGAADAMVFLANNVALVTGALAALSLAWLGLARTPIGLALTVAAGAAVALSSALRKNATPALSDADQAQRDLNAALGVFADTGAPDAGMEALALAEKNLALAESAYEAARAQAELNAQVLAGMAAPGVGTESNPAVRAIAAAAEEAAAEADAARERADAARRTVAELRADLANLPTGRARGIVIDGGEGGEDGDPPAVPSLGGGGAVANQLADRLEALQRGLATEDELIAEWYSESLATLREALDSRKLTEEEYFELRERLEREHQDRLNAIRDAGQSQAMTSAKGFFDGMASLAQAGGQRTAKIAAAIGAIQGTIDAYGAALKALNSPEPLTIGQRFSAYAGVLAAGLKGVMAIKQAGSGGGAGAVSSAGASSGASAAPAMARQNIIIDLVGDTFSRNSVQELFSQINDGLRSGYQIEGVLVR